MNKPSQQDEILHHVKNLTRKIEQMSNSLVLVCEILLHERHQLKIQELELIGNWALATFGYEELESKLAEADFILEGPMDDNLALIGKYLVNRFGINEVRKRMRESGDRVS